MKNYFKVLNQLEIGDRIVVPKSSARFVQHHAIYLGYQNGYHWIIENKEGIGVRTVIAESFFSDVIEITRIERFKPRQNYSRHDLYDFALSKRGDKYQLLNYNCESFANEVQHKVVKSKQANTGIFLGLTTVALFALGSLRK